MPLPMWQEPRSGQHRNDSDEDGDANQANITRTAIIRFCDRGGW